MLQAIDLARSSGDPLSDEDRRAEGPCPREQRVAAPRRRCQFRDTRHHWDGMPGDRDADQPAGPRVVVDFGRVLKVGDREER